MAQNVHDCQFMLLESQNIAKNQNAEFAQKSKLAGIFNFRRPLEFTEKSVCKLIGGFFFWRSKKWVSDFYCDSPYKEGAARSEKIEKNHNAGLADSHI